MNRNGKDECWHPECYMISKVSISSLDLVVNVQAHGQFWNVRLASKHFNTPANSAVSSAVSLLDMTSTSSTPALSSTASSASSATSPGLDTELTPEQLKDKQDAIETKVQQIWHVLSGYEESSAALIGDMLRAVNNRQLLEIILLAERFILYVEVLFAVIDDLEAQFALAGAKGESCGRLRPNSYTRHVTRSRSEAPVPPARQPVIGHVADIAQHAGPLHAHHPAGPLPQNSHSSRLNRRYQAREGSGQHNGDGQLSGSVEPPSDGQWRSNRQASRRPPAP
jgi:hypothetical protein